MRTLSSAQTFLIKVVVPLVWIPGFGLGALAIWMGAMPGMPGTPPPVELKWPFLVAWLAGAAFIMWGCIGLKLVRVDTRFLYVSNYLREISVPLGMIADVTENRWVSTHPITVHFGAMTEFGRQITFIPPWRFFGMWRSHPIVAELKRLAGLPGP